MKKLGKFELNKIYCGDCEKLMKHIPDNSIDLIVTDPPYQLSSTSRARPDQTKEGSYGREVPFSRQQSRITKGFMGKEWDVLPPIEVWKESLRILKSGALAFIMTTPRQDSLCQILIDLTNAGFYMSFSSIYWTYASGFPKASKSEKNKGLAGLEEKRGGSMEANITDKMQLGGASLKGEHKEIQKTKNIHPTVKPIKLTSYLITLGSREGDIILDNFCGSGSTLISAKILNRRFLGFDTEMEYVEIARARVAAIKHMQEKLL